METSHSHHLETHSDSYLVKIKPEIKLLSFFAIILSIAFLSLENNFSVVLQAVIVAGLLIVFVLCLGFYVTPAILGGGRVIMAAMKISSNIELYFSWGAASALGVVLLIVTAIILYIASKLVSLDQFGNK